MKIRVLRILTLAGLLMAAQAQAWTTSYFEFESAGFDHIQMQLVNTGQAQPDSFQAVGISNFGVAFGRRQSGDGSWAQTFNDGQMVIADGDSTRFLRFDLNFEGDRNPVTLNYQAWSGSSLLENRVVSWNRRGRMTSRQVNGPLFAGRIEASSAGGQIPVAEPSTFLLFGMGIVAMVVGLRRKPR